MPIPDEKSRAWTRPEDYWPPRRPRRTRRPDALRQVDAARDRGDPTDEPRPWLGIVPYAMLMMGLAVMAIAIMVVAWPGSRIPPKVAAESTIIEVGTAPKGWIDKD